MSLKLKIMKNLSSLLGGSHASPIEHVRAGTWVTSKTGKRFYRRGTVVNEGSTSGRVEKDYTASLGE